MNAKLNALHAELPQHPFRAKLLKLTDRAMDRGDEVLARHCFEKALEHLLRERAEKSAK